MSCVVFCCVAATFTDRLDSDCGLLIYLLFDAVHWINPPCFSEQHREAHGVTDWQSPQMNLQEQNMWNNGSTKPDQLDLDHVLI